MEPEKKLWTAETEIYRLVMSNGRFGDWKLVKSKSGFRFLDSKFGRNFLAADFLMFWLGFSLLKHDFGLQKIFFVPILIKMTPIEFCIFDIILYFWLILIINCPKCHSRCRKTAVSHSMSHSISNLLHLNP